jgi:hypothetical protein
MNVKGFGRKRWRSSLKNYPKIRLERLGETMKNFSRCSGRDSNRKSAQYKSEALALEPTCSVIESRMMRLARVGLMRNGYKILLLKSEGKNSGRR